jgi:hypothetical protein
MMEFYASSDSMSKIHVFPTIGVRCIIYTVLSNFIKYHQ